VFGSLRRRRDEVLLEVARPVRPAVLEPSHLLAIQPDSSHLNWLPRREYPDLYDWIELIGKSFLEEPSVRLYSHSHTQSIGDLIS